MILTNEKTGKQKEVYVTNISASDFVLNNEDISIECKLNIDVVEHKKAIVINLD